MDGWALPAAVALFTWFFATGAILWLDRRPSSTYCASLVGATAASGLAFAAIIISSESDSPAAVYVGFIAALVVWGWHEMSFLMGFVTGPNRNPCPADATGWRRFRFATATLIHHEIAIAATALMLLLLCWNQPNQIAAHTFLLLFVMRLSTKFNIFVGVPHLADDMMPAHLAYLKSYFGPRRHTPLMALSGVASVLLALWLAGRAFGAAAGSGAETGFVLLLALATLAIVEHVFLVLPFRDSGLWAWAVPHMQGNRKGTANGL